MRGEFYVASAGEGWSFGAARAVLEASHVEVEPSRWMKQSTVMAYQVAEPCRVETWLGDGTHETTVRAERGEWIVRQPGGELTMLDGEGFNQIYEPAE